MTTPRRKLTPNELTFVTTCFTNIRIDLLKPKQVDFIRSIKSQFEYDGMLSDKQLNALKKIKYFSDKAIRSKAIASGRLNFVQDDADRINLKLNSIYNPIGK